MGVNLFTLTTVLNDNVYFTLRANFYMYEITLGSSVLEQFSVYFDFDNQKMAFKPKRNELENCGESFKCGDEFHFDYTENKCVANADICEQGIFRFTINDKCTLISERTFVLFAIFVIIFDYYSFHTFEKILKKNKIQYY
jgi:hypothetical protein